jgi:enoyl-[acyl-carrier protein] reductase/trans-2-enoyl-CoA reductase (NAD+)
MGGEDWEMWIDALKARNLLVRSNYSLLPIGPSLTGLFIEKEQLVEQDHLEATSLYYYR